MQPIQPVFFKVTKIVMYISNIIMHVTNIVMYISNIIINIVRNMIGSALALSLVHSIDDKHKKSSLQIIILPASKRSAESEYIHCVLYFA